MDGSGATSAVPFAPGPTFGLKPPADRRGDALFAARRSALAHVAARSVPADDHGTALFLPLERDGAMAANQSCAAADGPRSDGP